MKHHYVPVFYLKRWAGLDGKICVFCAPFGRKVVARRVHPSGTGYRKDGYKLPGLEGADAYSLENSFFSPADSAAADALRKIYGESKNPWTLAERSAWTRFIMSLLFRDPESIDLLIRRMRVDYFKTNAESEARYAKQRQPEQPSSLRDFLIRNASQDYVDRGSLKILAKIIDLKETGSMINSMEWNTLNFGASCHALMTSDNPVVLTNGIGKQDAFILIPIGPSKAFLATNSRDVLERLTHSPANLAQSINRTVVASARKTVWAEDDGGLIFVQRHLSTFKPTSMMEKIALMSSKYT